MFKVRNKVHNLINFSLFASILMTLLFQGASHSVSAQTTSYPLSIVAIHVSETTQALEGIPATPPTPTGSGTSGFEWWYTSWHYFVMYESLKEALASDGTPYIEVTDAAIEAGILLHPDGSPKYPILFSLASEAVTDSTVSALRDYVDAGGFLFIGSSAFTRNPDGTTRGDFALADEMGLHMVTPSLSNWYQNTNFTKVQDHRLVSHIPSGSLLWRMPLTADEIPWGVRAADIHSEHYVWRVSNSDATVIANGGSGPLLATKGYGNGHLIYHGGMQPLIGHGSFDSGMYAYMIIRQAIEWAFESANLPLVKVSPWQYPYDAAFVIRHDLENTPSRIGYVESSAAYEASVGAKGDYYLCTGTIRLGSEDTQIAEVDKPTYVAGLQNAVSLYGATIGSHNGGFANPAYSADPSHYHYWHWGPDEVLEVDPATLPIGGYSSGYDYAYDSIELSFQDIEGWMAGLDNGRSGCGAAANCPRTWVAPFLNSAREESAQILEDLDSIIMGERKNSPFPHWTLSYKTLGDRFDHVSLPPSDWYVGDRVLQSAEDGHTITSVRNMIDFYHENGLFINLYNHSSSTSGVVQEYVSYNASKANIWAANAVDVSDWWMARTPVTVSPSYQQIDGTAITTAAISGATDPQTAIELVIPHWDTGAISNLQVFLDGAPAAPAAYRMTNYGVKVQVGSSITTVEVRYTPLEGWVQTNWIGGDGQAIWSDETRYESAIGIDDSRPGQLTLSLASGGTPLFSDDFTRPPSPPPVPFSWIIPTTSPTNGGVYNTNSGTLNASSDVTSRYGYAYTDTLTIDNHSVEADIRFPDTGTFGGGILGRLNAGNGQRYAAWIYPEGSSGVPSGYGPAAIKLIKYYDWGSWGGPLGMQTVSIAEVGSDWHHLKMTFNGDTIQVFYDGSEVINITDTDADGHGIYSSGYVGVDFYAAGNTYAPSYNNFEVRDATDAIVLSDDFGPDDPDPLLPWLNQMGNWAVDSGVLQGSSAASQYAYVFTNTLWTDYSVEGSFQFPTGAFGGGIGGRVDPATGAHYGAWIYPGSNVLRLIKYRDWTSWNGTPMQQVSLPSVGTGWHTLKMDFEGAQIRVYYDGGLLMDYTDAGYDARPAYLTGGVSVDLWTSSTPYVMSVDDVVVLTPAEYGSSGSLHSSAFDGGVGVQWQNISWAAGTSGSTTAQVRTRTADRADLLNSASWSAWYTTSGDPVSSPNRRWIQYQVAMSSSDPSTTPTFYENAITYIPGILLPGSNLTYTGPATADSESTPILSATLLDDNTDPIVGRIITYTLEGLAPVTGITNGAGEATAELDLLIAPGDYSLAIAFAGDSEFAPVTIPETFTVTSPWLSWVQETAGDFQSNNHIDTDATTQPGRVLLQETIIGAGEETGAFSVEGVPGWTYRRRLFIDNNVAGALPGGYSVQLALDTATLVSDGKLLVNGDDLRVVWDNGGNQVELDRLATSSFDDAATEIWFKTQAAIPGSSRDSHYFIYYGNPSAATPPADPEQVWALWDDFDGTTVDTSKWSSTGTITVGGGTAQLAVGANLFGITPYTHAMLDMHLQLGGEDTNAWWGWEEIPANANNLIIFEESPPGFQAWTLDDSIGWPNYTSYSLADPTPDGLTGWHTYTADWWTGNARWLIDGSEVASNSDNVPDSGIYANFNASQIPITLDWVRARLRVVSEPVVTLATPQPGYPADGQMLSIAYDTTTTSGWKYLTWDATFPANTAITLRVRTADTEAGLSSATWSDYGQSGLLLDNELGRWVQYEATLSTSDAAATPELHQVTVYYYHLPPTTVWVDASFDSSTHGWGVDRFATIQEGIDGVASGGTVHVAAGSFAEDVTLNLDATVLVNGDVTLDGSLTLAQGVWIAPDGTMTLTGDLTLSGGAFNSNGGTLVFGGSSVQEIIGTTVTLHNISVNSGVTLTTSAGVTLTGSLLNQGITQETKAVSGIELVSFGLADITIDVTTAGSLSSLQVNRIDSNHPEATEGIETGKYWNITPNSGATGFIVSLTLPHNEAPDVMDKVCRWDIGALEWDCAANDFNSLAGTISRYNVNQFSDWATGNNVGPTAIQIISIKALSQNHRALWLLTSIAICSGLFAMIWWRYRRSPNSNMD